MEEKDLSEMDDLEVLKQDPMTADRDIDQRTCTIPEFNRSNNTKRNDYTLLNVNQSEAGPEIATGLTSSDLKCATQFFKDAAELESQIRKNIAATSILSLNDVQDGGGEEKFHFKEVKERSDKCDSTEMYARCPPNEERSAPEGTCSPDPKLMEDAEASRETQINQHEITQLQKVTSSRDALLKLVEQYKEMLAALVAEKKKVCSAKDQNIQSLESEKVQAVEDLTNVEAAFSDVHRKYERTKQIVDSLRRNEETLREALKEYEEKVSNQEKKYRELQKHAEAKVQEANKELELMRRTNDQDVIKMSALLKKAEMKIISLQEALDRKTRENQELTQLCDDLINKVGS